MSRNNEKTAPGRAGQGDADDVDGVYVELVDATKSAESGRSKDCLACRVTGSGGLLAIAAYLYSNGMKHPVAKNKMFINSIATGRFSSPLSLSNRFRVK